MIIRCENFRGLEKKNKNIMIDIMWFWFWNLFEGNRFISYDDDTDDNDPREDNIPYLIVKDKMSSCLFIVKHKYSFIEHKIYELVHPMHLMHSDDNKKHPPCLLPFFSFHNVLLLEYKKKRITLSQYLEYDYPLKYKKITKIKLIFQLLTKLKYLHEKKIAWIDIHPKNILVDEETLECFPIDFESSFLSSYPSCGSKGCSPPFFTPSCFLDWKKKGRFYLPKDLKKLQAFDMFVMGMIIFCILKESYIVGIHEKWMEKSYEEFLEKMPKYIKEAETFFQESPILSSCFSFSAHMLSLLPPPSRKRKNENLKN